MLTNTLYSGLPIMEATEENLTRTADENYEGTRYWGRIMEVRDTNGNTIDTPGLVVLEIPEELYDIESEQMYSGLIYWLATENDIFEVPGDLVGDLCLGAPRGIVDADFMNTPGNNFTGTIRNNETLIPLDKLIEFNALKNASMHRERVEIDHNFAMVLIESLR